MPKLLRRPVCLALPAAVAACALPRAPADSDAGDGVGSGDSQISGGPEPAWHEVRLPGKKPTRYVSAMRDGRRVVHARAEGSASMWRQQLRVPARELAEVQWSWRVDRLNPQASVDDVEREDAVARLLFAFDGDRSRLPARTQAQFDLARALTGESPPFATLMYVWETARPQGSLIVNGRTDRVRKIVVDSGAQHLGRWREHRRDLVADFRLAFGEDPGPLIAIALMTDTDNTRARAEAWYGAVHLRRAV